MFGDIEQRKLVTVGWHKILDLGWHKILDLLNEYGLGIRSLKDIKIAAIMKHSWDLIISNQHWTITFRGRVFIKYEHIKYDIDSFIWTVLKAIYIYIF